MQMSTQEDMEEILAEEKLYQYYKWSVHWKLDNSCKYKYANPVNFIEIKNINLKVELLEAIIQEFKLKFNWREIFVSKATFESASESSPEENQVAKVTYLLKEYTEEY